MAGYAMAVVGGPVIGKLTNLGSFLAATNNYQVPLRQLLSCRTPV
jgi:hypothetical protein